MPKPAYQHTTSEAFWDTPIYMQSTTKLEQTGSTSDLCKASQCIILRHNNNNNNNNSNNNNKMNKDLGATLVRGECSHHYTTLAPQLGTNQGRREKFRGR